MGVGYPFCTTRLELIERLLRNDLYLKAIFRQFPVSYSETFIQVIVPMLNIEQIFIGLVDINMRNRKYFLITYKAQLTLLSFQRRLV
ncbi:hypothetical protein D5R81_14245 [Parashewanella spongiae]|uniref:Uncharacterized protein n=1 Tax=Parashewanella spongiae TaxID=342950 RepID=A0A3A6TIV9_9GAMM|nr:hypothetical protein D5R81_14245 [Parashewanella spongiae]